MEDWSEMFDIHLSLSCANVHDTGTDLESDADDTDHSAIGSTYPFMSKIFQI